MTEKQKIEAFLAQEHIAVAGFSRDPRKFGAQVYELLKNNHYKVYAVNPAGGETPDKKPVYSSITDLPENVKALWIGVKPEITNRLIREAGERGFRHVWVQQMAGDRETLDLLNESEMLSVSKRCIFMFANPTGFHKFHHWLSGFFGRIPK